MEDPGLVHSALGDQEMEVGVGIHPGAECLDGRDNPSKRCSYSVRKRSK
jgi:hypothetical protein